MGNSGTSVATTKLDHKKKLTQKIARRIAWILAVENRCNIKSAWIGDGFLGRITEDRTADNSIRQWMRTPCLMRSLVVDPPARIVAPAVPDSVMESPSRGPHHLPP